VLCSEFDLSEQIFESIVPSDHPYHYRHRLDLKLLNSKNYGLLIGFSPQNRFRVIPIDACPIARQEISDFLPRLKNEVAQRLTETKKYRVANLTVRCGEDGIVHWGGIGRRSLRMSEKDYFSTEINGLEIFYSLDTFFQANLSILPKLINRIQQLNILEEQTTFLDLYSGVGLFGLSFARLVKKVILIEECPHAVKLAEYNRGVHQFDHMDIIQGKVQDHLPEILLHDQGSHCVAMIDPPRNGLTPKAVEALQNARQLKSLLYLSCNPASLVRDLKSLIEAGWRVQKVIPFDFFPRTKHLETLVFLKPKEELLRRKYEGR